jgi:predicted RNA-binding Zn-ribbon protein involved in translation (DUF1610 family)
MLKNQTSEDIAFAADSSAMPDESIQAYSKLRAMADTVCPDCAIEMSQIEKTTFTGRDMREYQCPKCGRKQIVDCGKALWEILSEANEDSTKE